MHKVGILTKVCNNVDLSGLMHKVCNNVDWSKYDKSTLLCIKLES